jgi:hypothetical protein
LEEALDQQVQVLEELEEELEEVLEEGLEAELVVALEQAVLLFVE